MLADGLSGLRTDLGAFSRAKADDLQWDNRKKQLLNELVQYKPDLITLQECDHYYDFFLPELTSMGYDGLFAPKPSSACLEVSENSDGCAIFLKRDKFRVVSTQTITYALSKSDVIANQDQQTAKEEDRQIKAQNQIALVVLCDLVGTSATETTPPQIILCTTHLKATKNIIGERTRLLEVQQLLGSVQRLYSAKNKEASSKGHAEPLILITGDLNAAPNDGTGFEALAYTAVKESPLGLRSVLNDDFTTTENQDVWTTWKARRKQGKESIAKSCIDYILYRPLTAPPLLEAGVRYGGIRAGMRTKAVLGLYSEKEIGEGLLPSALYPSDHLAIAADLQVLVLRD